MGTKARRSGSVPQTSWNWWRREFELGKGGGNSDLSLPNISNAEERFQSCIFLESQHTLHVASYPPTRSANVSKAHGVLFVKHSR